MSNINIGQAIELIWDLMKSLEDSYWEASTLDRKDRIFNLIQLLNSEYTELLKLSVQDHHYEYEVISTSEEALQTALSDHLSQSSPFNFRTATAQRLNSLLKRFAGTLISTHQ